MGEPAIRSHAKGAKHKEATEAQTTKRKSVLDELENLKKRKKNLESDKTSLEKKADELAEQAERSRKIALVTQSNSMRKTARDKAKDIEQISKDIDYQLHQLKDN
jgi:hypothetical protein